MEPIRASAIQMRSQLGDANQNCQKIKALATQAIQDGARLICFPEACLTGYNAQRAADLALDLDDARVLDLISFSAQQDIVLSFGLIERGDALPFVTQVICFNGQMFTYRKTHLGTSEHGWFAAGDAIQTVQTPAGCLGVSLCWECSIPDVAGTLRAKGAEVILAPFASPLGGMRRLESWATYLPARARDNGAYVVACNALKDPAAEDVSDGSDGSGNGGGCCAIYDPHGKLLDSCNSNNDELLTYDLSAELPRTSTSGSMRDTSFYDCRRPELYS